MDQDVLNDSIYIINENDNGYPHCKKVHNKSNSPVSVPELDMISSSEDEEDDNDIKMLKEQITQLKDEEDDADIEKLKEEITQLKLKEQHREDNESNKMKDDERQLERTIDLNVSTVDGDSSDTGNEKESSSIEQPDHQHVLEGEKTKAVKLKPPRPPSIKTFQDVVIPNINDSNKLHHFSVSAPSTPTITTICSKDDETTHEVLIPSSPSVRHLKSMFQHEEEADCKNKSSFKKGVLSSVQEKKLMFEKLNQEEISNRNPTLHWKKTWKAQGSGYGRYKKHIWDTRGVAPKKCLHDLP